MLQIVNTGTYYPGTYYPQLVNTGTCYPNSIFQTLKTATGDRRGLTVPFNRKR